ncbi:MULTISPECIES: flagellar basal body-associated protein FliL [Sutcliffiella]|uniref:Flagellar protein FliL n=1 Tax=Sutcliffiella cohnii TaxID=33932 RepID=A0A223KRE2_9BACI|nr:MULTISPECIES: flagellar basal body-associated protein FliL [Sutcliffiella]AST92052.1 flagellar basal body-associated protein FliL [Sutcliffiella cohnii]MED4015333.1 flagellar basal body-associated protein FliL [Sutcliffiella cohnii]WBL13286.1 flagellar basal body-associated protein FliL [Sutcliffiella sp. NC1]
MFQNKLLNKMMIIILVIALLGIVAFFTLDKIYAKPTDGEPSIDEILQYSQDLEEITTNLKNGGYVRIQFKVQTDSKKAKNELIKRDFQIRNTIIHLISDKDKKDFSGKESLQNIEEEIETALNEFMEEGKVVSVYITSFLLQN